MISKKEQVQMNRELMADVNKALTRYRDDEIRFLLRAGFSKEESIKVVHWIINLLRRIEVETNITP
jgi:hypothetical protein